MKPMNISALIIGLLSACANQPSAQNTYTPGLGEFMTQLSYRHGKLWFAGQAQNWELAAYELDEIKEGLSDISQYHPNHHEVKGIPGQIERHMTAPIEQTAQAITAKNAEAFAAGFDGVTAGCNACHQANGFGFNVIVTPQANNYPNQQFILRSR